LHRNFQGYTTRADCDLIGLCVSAIGKVGASYSQSVRNIHAYYDRLDQGRSGIDRGFELSPEDQLRRQVIMDIMCGKPVHFATISHQYGIDFIHYFANELVMLQPFVEEGLVRLDSGSLYITDQGRLFVRAVAMVFDQYLSQPAIGTYSKLI
jgi:oxygen-independent coproporphyrinogen-3 oxidase